MRRHRRARGTAAAAIAIAVLAGHGGLSAFAAAPERPDKKACVAAYEKAQALRRSGKLLDARAALVVCSQPSCPAAAVADCVPWLEDVERSLPSVVVVARDAGGRDVPDVRVLVDGLPLASTARGMAAPVDPGEHLFRFESSAGPSVEQRVVLREGEKRRTLAATFGAPVAACPGGLSCREPARPVPPAVWALGAVALGGLAVFAGAGASSLVAESNLRATCAPRCAPDDVQSIRTRHTAADIGLGVGAAALVAGSILFFTRPTIAASVSLQPRPAGGGAVLSGAF